MTPNAKEKNTYSRKISKFPLKISGKYWMLKVVFCGKIQELSQAKPKEIEAGEEYAKSYSCYKIKHRPSVLTTFK